MFSQFFVTICEFSIENFECVKPKNCFVFEYDVGYLVQFFLKFVALFTSISYRWIFFRCSRHRRRPLRPSKWPGSGVPRTGRYYRSPRDPPGPSSCPGGSIMVRDLRTWPGPPRCPHDPTRTKKKVKI